MALPLTRAHAGVPHVRTRGAHNAPPKAPPKARPTLAVQAQRPAAVSSLLHGTRHLAGVRTAAAHSGYGQAGAEEPEVLADVQDTVQPAPPLSRRHTLLGVACGCTACLASTFPLINLPGQATAASHPITTHIHRLQSQPVLGRVAWYDEYFAYSMHTGMADYEDAVAPIKATLSRKVIDTVTGPSLNRPVRILELGIGTGPNLKFLVAAAAQSAADAAALANIVSASIAETSGAMPLAAVAAGTPRQLQITGVDPNPAMQAYAAQAARASGLHVVDGVDDKRVAKDADDVGTLQLVVGQAEALPFPDASFDAAVITLVLCSVKDPAAALSEVRRVLRPGGALMCIEHVGADWSTQPALRIQQQLLDPLQSALADGCHLTRDTGAVLKAAGFSKLELSQGSIEGVGGLLAPHVWGVAIV